MGFSINCPHLKIWTFVNLCPQVYEKGRELILLNSKNFFFSLDKIKNFETEFEQKLYQGFTK